MHSAKHILVTGSSGMIGTALCEALLEIPGMRVTGVDWKENTWNPRLQEHTIMVDLRDRAAVMEKLPKDVDVIVHLAANARVYDLVQDPSMARDNIETTFNVLEFARENHIPKFIFSSSREVYGNTDVFVHKEGEANHANCESPYTASKIADEAMIWAYHRCYGMDIMIFRFSNVYGRYDDSNRAVPLFIRKAKQNEPITIFGKEKLLDFTFLDDTVRGVMLGIERFDVAKNHVINLATGKGVTILEVAERIVKELGSSSALTIENTRTGEVMKYIADIAEARSLLGYEPTIEIEEGIARSITWYASRP